jgi:hypothetical protein
VQFCGLQNCRYKAARNVHNLPPAIVIHRSIA